MTRHGGGVTAVLEMIRRISEKNIHIWIRSYLERSLRLPISHVEGPIHIIFCFVDHFEPWWNNADPATARRRVDSWVERYPKVARKYRDSDGRHPQHTFFYPQEEYCPEFIEKLSLLCKMGFGEVEVHLHHDRDTAEGLREKLLAFTRQLRHEHGLLPSLRTDRAIRYGFIHGNWALDNSRKDGRWCGVNNELTILRETGCYADFTLPSAPSDTQTSKVNSIYYATDDPVRPKSHNSGQDVRVGGTEAGDLLIVQGPLALNWGNRALKILPRIETGEVSKDNPPTPTRVDLWVRQHIHVLGRPEWVFVKIHTHGAQEGNQEILLGRACENMHEYLLGRYNDGRNYVLHYATAREMYNIIKAAEAGGKGSPSDYRDYLLCIL